MGADGMVVRGALTGLVLAGLAGLANAAVPYSCGGFAMMGGAQLVCSHIDVLAPPQMCTYSWALTTMTGAPAIVEGSFLLPPGASNASVYQGAGFSGELSMPIVLCQAKKSR